MIKIKKRIFQILGFLGLRCTDFFVNVEKVVGNRYPLAAGSCSKVSARITILTAPLIVREKVPTLHLLCQFFEFFCQIEINYFDLVI